MTIYHCQICKKGSTSLSGLTQHVNAVHGGRRTLSQGLFENESEIIQESRRPVHNEALWNTSIFLRPSSQAISTEIPAEFPKEISEETFEVDDFAIEEMVYRIV
jgi:hypothetical protein